MVNASSYSELFVERTITAIHILFHQCYRNYCKIQMTELFVFGLEMKTGLESWRQNFIDLLII